jgi:hypothetical protein
MALATSNSELRSDLLKLGMDYEVALATIKSLQAALGETELLLEVVDRKRLELLDVLTSISLLASDATL